MRSIRLYLAFFVGLCLLSHCKNNITKPEVSSNLSFTVNSDGLWQIGYSADSTLSLDQFRLCTFPDTSDIIGMWHPSKDPNGYYPYLAQNRSEKSELSKTNGWATRPYQIAMEGSNNGQFSLLRFIAPVTGVYKIRAVFEGIHFGLSTTDVHILHNSNSIFSELIEGYGGDPFYHKIEGSHPSATYENSLSLKKNDILTFAVGYGANKNHYSDTTGLLIFIEIV